MRQSSSSILPPTSSVSFFEKYEKMFHCGGCIADDEPVAAIYQQSRYGNEESNLTTEAISNWSSYIRERRQQESAPLGTVLLNQATSGNSYDEIDKFDIEERTSKRQQSKTKAVQTKVKAQTEATTAMNEYFTGVRNSHQPEIQMAIQRSPTTTMMTQQQQRRRQQQQHCHSTPIKSNTTVIPTSSSTKPFSPKTSKQPLSPPKTRLQQYDMFQVVMPRSFRSSLTGPAGQQHRHNEGGSWKDTLHSDSTQSTQSLSESDDDDLSWGLEENEEQQPPLQEQEQETPVVSILRRKVKFETRTETTRTEKNRVRRVVRFEPETKFLDPNEVPSSTRKQVPRMSPQQKQEYRMMHTSYPPTTSDRQRQRQRQLDVSLFLMEPAAAVGPSRLVRTLTPNNQDEFRDSSRTATKKNSTANNMMMCSSSSHPERLARRAQQNQYHPHHHRSHSSATLEEVLFSHYYTPNQ